jgi:hypothetical protein
VVDQLVETGSQPLSDDLEAGVLYFSSPFASNPKPLPSNHYLVLYHNVYHHHTLIASKLFSLSLCLSLSVQYTPLTSTEYVLDFALMPSFFQGKTPCYIVFRLDTKNDQGFQWMLCSYVPDGSPVRQRMLYGSTRELLKRHLGSNYFASDMHGSSVV